VFKKSEILCWIRISTSYGLTICAERSAVFAGVCAEGPSMKLRAAAIVGEDSLPCPPCGACRQVLNEFGRDAAVIFLGPNGRVRKSVAELMPFGFAIPEPPA
jgi:cytidine deaminase